jgi:hypothetical protein
MSYGRRRRSSRDQIKWTGNLQGFEPLTPALPGAGNCRQRCRRNGLDQA